MSGILPVTPSTRRSTELLTEEEFLSHPFARSDRAEYDRIEAEYQAEKTRMEAQHAAEAAADLEILRAARRARDADRAWEFAGLGMR